MVIGTSDPIVRAWLVAPYWFTPTVLGLQGHTDEVMAVALSELDGQPVAVTGSRYTTPRLWHLGRRELLHGPLTGHTAPGRVLAGTDQGILALDIQPGSAQAAHVPGAL